MSHSELVKNTPTMQETLVQFLGLEIPLEKGQSTHSSQRSNRLGTEAKRQTALQSKVDFHETLTARFMLQRTSLVAQMVKNMPEMQETQVQSLDQEDPPEKEMATNTSILASEIP